MSLTKLKDNWYQFGNGLKWRVTSPNYYCEVARENHIPVFTQQDVVNKVRRVKMFYQSRLRLGQLDQFGYGVDILVANSFAESGGSVPTSVNTQELVNLYNASAGSDPGMKLNNVISFLASRGDTRSLLRKEPGYVSPISTPEKLSVGAHHSLISTALWIQGKRPPYNVKDIFELITRLPAESVFAAQQAELYFIKQFAKHMLQPPLLAACYNAGSIRSASTNEWGIASTGDHIDRWVKYFNTSRTLNKQTNTPPSLTSKIVPEVIFKPLVSSQPTFSSERIIAAMKRNNYVVNETGSKPFDLNLIGLRNPNGKLNVFDDKMIVLWKQDGIWNLKAYTITTDPGTKFINSIQNGGELLNASGTAILVPGQYSNSHIIGIHRGYEALKQHGTLKVYRDSNLNNQLDYDPTTIKEAGPDAAINIHRANPSKTSVQVDSWSAGCQVFSAPNEFGEFMDLCKKRSENHGKIFTYTLMLWSDL